MKEILSGQSQSEIISLNQEFKIHKDAKSSFLKLIDSAKVAGFDMQVSSSYRDFKAQANIWNTKALGQRALLDAHGEVIDHASLSPNEIIDAILRWSALPGASRHHWGSDIDVYDKSRFPTPDYQVELTPHESNTYFDEFHQWLDQRITDNESFGFYRPYTENLGGVSPERWHLSYAPVSKKYLEQMNVDLLREVVKESQIELKEAVLERIEEIFEKYVLRITPAPF